VQEYTRRDLSDLDDKRAAISAVGRQQREESGHTYLAVLWNSSPGKDLLWFKDPFSDNICHPIEYRARTWSWCAGEDTVVFNEGGSFEYRDVLFEIERENADFSRIQSAVSHVK
jgi:hypothetical protein